VNSLNINAPQDICATFSDEELATEIARLESNISNHDSEIPDDESWESWEDDKQNLVGLLDELKAERDRREELLI
jgi:hypothetical protein